MYACVGVCVCLYVCVCVQVKWFPLPKRLHAVAQWIRAFD